MESSRALLLTISAQMENPDQAHGSWIQLEPAAIIMAIWGLNLQMENLSVLVSLTDCNSASQINNLFKVTHCVNHIFKILSQKHLD